MQDNRIFYFTEKAGGAMFHSSQLAAFTPPNTSLTPPLSGQELISTTEAISLCHMPHPTQLYSLTLMLPQSPVLTVPGLCVPSLPGSSSALPLASIFCTPLISLSQLDLSMPRLSLS